MKLDELALEAEKLPEEDRASLVARLLHGLERTHHYVSDDEVQRRICEADEDPSVMISFEQLISGLQTRAS